MLGVNDLDVHWFCMWTYFCIYERNIGMVKEGRVVTFRYVGHPSGKKLFGGKIHWIKQVMKGLDSMVAYRKKGTERRMYKNSPSKLIPKRVDLIH